MTTKKTCLRKTITKLNEKKIMEEKDEPNVVKIEEEWRRKTITKEMGMSSQ